MKRETYKLLMEKMISGTKQEIAISARLLSEDITFKNLNQFAKIFNCSNSSVTRFVKSLGFFSFKHFLYDYHYQEKKQIQPQNDSDIFKYKLPATQTAKLIKGKIYIFCSIRGKSIGKFFNERLNSINIPNDYYHESWAQSLDSFANQVSAKDTAILITLNGESFIASKILKALEATKRNLNIIILTASRDISKFQKYHCFSLGQIDNIDYKIDSFDGYNYASAKIIAFMVTLLREISSRKITTHNKENNNLTLQ